MTGIMMLPAEVMPRVLHMCIQSVSYTHLDVYKRQSTSTLATEPASGATTALADAACTDAVVGAATVLVAPPPITIAPS